MTKHIDIKYHFIRNHVQKDNVKLEFIPTDNQVANIFTKPLDKSKFVYFRGELGMLVLNA